MSDTRAADTERVRHWLETRFGGTVTELRRQPRWRPVWFATVERDGTSHQLVVRGDRTDMPLIFQLRHEMTLQLMLHDHGIPTPAVHGWIDEPMAGRSDFPRSGEQSGQGLGSGVGYTQRPRTLGG